MCVGLIEYRWPKKIFPFLFQKLLKHSHVGNFGIITSKKFLSMLLNYFINTKFFSFTSYKMFMIILSMDFIKANGLNWLHKSSIQDVNWGKYLFTVSLFFILLILTYYYGKFFQFVLLMSSLWWVGGKNKQSSLYLDILDNFLLVFYA